MTCQLLHLLVQHLAMLDVASLAVKVLYKLLKRQISSSLVTALATIISFSHSIVLLGQSSLSLELHCNKGSNIPRLTNFDVGYLYLVMKSLWMHQTLMILNSYFYDYIKIL